jgi:hypothetical protein
METYGINDITDIIISALENSNRYSLNYAVNGVIWISDNNSGGSYVITIQSPDEYTSAYDEANDY